MRRKNDLNRRKSLAKSKKGKNVFSENVSLISLP